MAEEKSTGALLTKEGLEYFKSKLGKGATSDTATESDIDAIFAGGGGSGGSGGGSGSGGGTVLNMTSLGDGLYKFGNDLVCTYPLLSTVRNEDNIVYEFKPYLITVRWTNIGDNEKADPTWERTYNTEGV